MWISYLLWPVEKFLLLIAGGGLGLAALTIADYCKIIVPGFTVITYSEQWILIWSTIGLVFFGLTLAVALWRDRIYERNKPFALRASWVLGKDRDQCFVPKGPGALGPTLCDSIQWQGRNWPTIEASFPGWTPVRKANPVASYFRK